MPEKEIRAMPTTIEIRAAEGEDGKRTITGAIKYNTESQVMRDFWGDEFVEIIDKEAFKDSLATRNVVALSPAMRGRGLKLRVSMAAQEVFQAGSPAMRGRGLKLTRWAARERTYLIKNANWKGVLYCGSALTLC